MEGLTSTHFQWVRQRTFRACGFAATCQGVGLRLFSRTPELTGNDYEMEIRFVLTI